MATKLNPGNYDCYANLEPDEPYFLLMARDRHAPNIVRRWAKRRERAIQEGTYPESDREKVKEARAVASQMETWRKNNRG